MEFSILYGFLSRHNIFHYGSFYLGNSPTAISIFSLFLLTWKQCPAVSMLKLLTMTPEHIEASLKKRTAKGKLSILMGFPPIILASGLLRNNSCGDFVQEILLNNHKMYKITTDSLTNMNTRNVEYNL